MQAGRIIEVGSHTDLLASRSLYYHLYKAQFDYKAQFEHALSMPIPEEWASSVNMPGAGQDRLARAIQESIWKRTRDTMGRREGYLAPFLTSKGVVA